MSIPIGDIIQRLCKLYLFNDNLITLIVVSEDSVNRPDEGELVKFTKDELNVPKEGRIYKRKTSSKQRVKCQYAQYVQQINWTYIRHKAF